MSNLYFTKFCGITTIEDAIDAQSAGCEAIGFVFVKKSKRYISVEKCRSIIEQLSPMIIKVALFADNSEEEIQEVLNKCDIHVLQFHGNETPEFCTQWMRPFWKAIPMADQVDAIEYASKYPDASGYLIDNYGTKKMGGSGESFDWKRLPQGLSKKWILAGGLNLDNIKAAKLETSIKCFDVSSGIEKRPGVKCKDKMIKFIEKLND